MDAQSLAWHQHFAQVFGLAIRRRNDADFGDASQLGHLRAKAAAISGRYGGCPPQIVHQADMVAIQLRRQLQAGVGGVVE